MVGILDMKMIKLDFVTSHQSVSIYFCVLLNSWQVFGKCDYVLVSHIILYPWVCTAFDVTENFLLTRVMKNPARYFRFSFKKLLDLSFSYDMDFVSVTGKNLLALWDVCWPNGGAYRICRKKKMSDHLLTLHVGLNLGGIMLSVEYYNKKCCEICRNHWPDSGEFIRRKK